MIISDNKNAFHPPPPFYLIFQTESYSLEGQWGFACFDLQSWANSLSNEDKQLKAAYFIKLYGNLYEPVSTLGYT